MSSPSHYTPPGHIGNPDITPRDDPRFNPNLLQQLAAIGMDVNLPAHDLTSHSPLDQIAKLMEESSKQIVGLYEAIDTSLPTDEHEPTVDRTDLTIDGPAGAPPIKIHVFRQASAGDETQPCVVYAHGGGMTILDTINPVHVRWLTSLALAGVTAIAIDFRNAWTPAQHNPFPAGLNDCAAGVRYIASHKAQLHIGKLIVQGESGGGNLAIATALKAKREGWLAAIDGVYACVPYISNVWSQPRERLLAELPSLVENDGYLITRQGMACMGAYYTYEDADRTDPLAWPYHASVEELKGLPPHVIHVDELDPLRDEGVAFYRKLSQAGVAVDGRLNLGVTHGASMIFRKALPELNRSVVQSIAAFAKGL